MYIERIWGFFYQGFNYDISFIVSWPEACSTERAPVSVAKFLYTHNTNRERSLYAEHTLGINFVSRQSMTHLRRKTKSLLATSLFLVDQKRPKEMLAGRVQRPLKNSSWTVFTFRFGWKTLVHVINKHTSKDTYIMFFKKIGPDMPKV